MSRLNDKFTDMEMNKAEEITKKILKASDDYIHKRVYEDDCGYTGDVQPAFIEGAEWGYKQAQKDLALTKDDMKYISELYDRIPYMKEEDFYDEMLRRFKAYKGI